MKHTKGPWITMQSPSGNHFVRANGNIRIANCATNDVDEATEFSNAQLIAAAPEMLEALEYLFNQTTLRISPVKNEEILNLIKKAKGE